MFKMIKQILCSLLAISSVSALTFGPSISDLEVSTHKELEEYDSLIKAVFKDGDTLSPTQTLEFLIKLRDAVSSLDQQKYSDLSTKFNLLVRLSQLNDDDKCQYRYLMGFKFLVINNMEYSRNVFDYIKYFWRRQLETCKDYLARAMFRSIDRLNEGEKNHIESLRIKVLSAIPDKSLKDRFAKSPLNSFSKGVLQYFEEDTNMDLKNFLIGRKGKSLFKKEFEERVVDLCSRSRAKFKSTLDTYDLFVHDRDFDVDTLYAIPKRWLENMKICQILCFNKKFFWQDLYDELKKKYPELKQKRFLFF